MINFFRTVSKNWSSATADKTFRTTLITGLVITGLIVAMLPPFYRHLEARPGIVLHDILLNKIPSYNVSVPVFIIIWGMICLGITRCLTTPHIFLNYMMGFIIVTFFRTICLSTIALDPPIGIVE